MNRSLLAMTLCALPCLTVPARASLPYQQMDDATVRVIARHSGSIGLGSGFVIANGRYIVTNDHVIANAEEIDVFARLFKSRVARIVAESPEKDLAVLELAENMARPGVVLGLGASTHKTQTVLAAGFPAAADEAESTRDDLLDVKFTQGIISGLVRGQEGAALYEISAAVNPGNSGGPLFDECGRVIGINVAKSLVNAYVVGDDGQPTTQRVPLGEGIAWSIQADELLGLLRSQNIPIQAESTVCTPGAQTESLPPVGIQSGSSPVPTSQTGTSPALAPSPPKPLAARLTPRIIGGLIALAILVIVIIILVVRSLDRQPIPGRVVPPPPNERILPPPSPVKPLERTLRGISGNHAGMEFPISEVPLVFGRDPTQSQIVFNKTDTLIGRKHCVIRFDRMRDAVVIEDCGSVNGTFLENGEKLRGGEPRLLLSNARFYLGSREYMFQLK